MNKRKFKYLLCIGLLSVILWSGKAEATLEGQGSIVSEEVMQMNEDTEFLESQVQELSESIQDQNRIHTTKRKDQIKSKGTINFENGKVCLKAEDLMYLADEIDQLESRYKSNLIEALNQIGIYFRKDGTHVYDSQQNEIHTEELKVSISLGSILQGIIWADGNLRFWGKCYPD